MEGGRERAREKRREGGKGKDREREELERENEWGGGGGEEGRDGVDERVSERGSARETRREIQAFLIILAAAQYTFGNISEITLSCIYPSTQ